MFFSNIMLLSNHNSILYETVLRSFTLTRVLQHLQNSSGTSGVGPVLTRWALQNSCRGEVTKLGCDDNNQGCIGDPEWQK